MGYDKQDNIGGISQLFPQRISKIQNSSQLDSTHHTISGNALEDGTSNGTGEDQAMRRIFYFGILLLAGCQNIRGPLEYRQPVRVDDPLLSISEQKRLGRERLALPDESFEVGPKSGFASDFGGTR